MADETPPTVTGVALPSMRVDEALDAIGAKSPVPGGGAVASLTAALSAATGRMVLSYSQGRKSLAEHAELHDEAVEALERLRARAFELADADAEAYGHLNALGRLPEDDPRRRAEWDDAVRGAIDAPRQAMLAARELAEWLSRLAGRTNKWLNSDLAIAALLADAAARAAAWNVRVNLPEVCDETVKSDLAAEVESTLAETARLSREVEAACR